MKSYKNACSGIFIFLMFLVVPAFYLSKPPAQALQESDSTKLFEGLSPNLGALLREDPFYLEMKRLEVTGAFHFAELSLAFDELLTSLEFDIAEDKLRISSSQHWQEVFYRVLAAA